MEIMDLILQRHSVRHYLDKPIEEEKRVILQELIDNINSQTGLHIQAIYDEPKCFNSIMAHYGKFDGCSNYISIVGKKGKDLDEKTGYYGEQIVLKAQEIGLNTCWVYITHGKSKAKVNKGEKESVIISIGYGATQGHYHEKKPIEQLCETTENVPDWYLKGLEAARHAPTAVNQQKFKFSYKDGKVYAVATGGMFCSQMDLGIVKYHFEVVTGVKVD